MCKDLVVERIDQKCPFPIHAVVFEYSHIGHNDLNWSARIPIALYLVGKFDVFFSVLLFVAVFASFRLYSGYFAALMSQIVRKYPSCFLKHIFCKHMVPMRRMFLMLLEQELRKQRPVFLVLVQRSLAFFPFVVTGFADSRELTEKDDWIFRF